MRHKGKCLCGDDGHNFDKMHAFASWRNSNSHEPESGDSIVDVVATAFYLMRGCIQVLCSLHCGACVRFLVRFLLRIGSALACAHDIKM